MRSDVFCSPKIYGQVFFETREFMAIADIRPILPGHTLIIPKRHVSGITDLTDGELAALREVLDAVIPKLLKAYNADSYNLSINAGKSAGMVIDHLHFHLVPRSMTDMYHGKIVDFYRTLQKERIRHIKSVGAETARLRKIFKYRTRQKEL